MCNPLCLRTLRVVVCLSATRLVGTMARTCSTMDAALTRLTHPIIRIQMLAAVVYGGFIYTSTDSGVTWTEQTNSTAGKKDPQRCEFASKERNEWRQNRIELLDCATQFL